MTLLIRHTDVLGGIVGGFPPLLPFAGWRTYGVAATYTDPDGLEFPAFRLTKLSGPVADTMTQNSARTQSYFVDKVWPYSNTLIRGSFPGLAWYLLDPTTLGVVAGPLLPLGNAGNATLTQHQRDITPQIDHYVQWYDHLTPITGPYIAIQVAREPTEALPLFVSGHPVEIVTHLLTVKSEAYDATSAAAVTASLGSQLQHIMAVTSPDETPQDIIDRLSAAYGFLIRRSQTTGDAEFVHWREKLGSIAALPVIDGTMIREEGGPTFQLGDDTRLNRVKISGDVITKWNGEALMTGTKQVRKRFLGLPTNNWKTVNVLVPSTETPASRLMIATAEITFDYSTDGVTPDADSYGEQEAAIDLGGMPGVSDPSGGASPINLEQFGEGVARLLFDAHSRGRQMATVIARRDTDADSALLGEAITLDLDHLPNAQLGQTPTSQRGGTRPFRVVERTEECPGPVVLLADEGTGVQYGTAPTISVALDASPGMWAVTVTNASTLAADGAQVEFQVKAFLSTETPDFTDPGFRYTIDDATTWPDSPQVVRIGPFPIEHQVHVRARAFLFGGSASAWSAWDGLGGGAVTGAISGLTIGTPTSDGVALSWTNTNTTALVRVQLKQASIPTYSTVVDLPAASIAYTLTGLTAATSYNVRVVLVQNDAEVGTALTGTFTTASAASQTTLTTPTNPYVFGGNPPGEYGLAVTAVFGPPGMTIVFEVAVETAVGSGTPGSYTAASPVPAIAGDVTTYSAAAPNDGKRRYLRAKATASGYTDSAYTTALAIDPWASPPVTVGQSPVLTPGVGVLRLFGYAPEISTSAPAGSYTDEQAQDAVGGILDDGTTGDIVFTYADATPKISAVTQDGTITEAKFSFSDNTTANASTGQHGLLKKLPGGTTTFLRADGTFATPSASGGSAEPEFYTFSIWEKRAAKSQNAFLTSMTPRTITGAGSTAANNDADGAYIRQSTGAVSGNVMSQLPGTYDTTERQLSPVIVFNTKSDASVADLRLWCGWFTASPSGAADPALSIMAFRFDTGAGDTQFMAVTKDGTTINATATGITPATTTKYVFRINAGASSVEFYINDVLVHTSSSNLPAAATALGEGFTLTTLTGAAKSWNLSFMRMAHRQ